MEYSKEGAGTVGENATPKRQDREIETIPPPYEQPNPEPYPVARLRIYEARSGLLDGAHYSALASEGGNDD